MPTNFFDINGYALEDVDGNVVLAKGVTVPTDNTSGFITGCLFMKTDGGSNTAIYVNEGDADNCNFDAIPTSGGGGATAGLDSVYSLGDNTVTLDEGAINFTDASAGALNTLEFVKTGTGSGNVIDISVDAALTGHAIGIDMNLGIAANAIYIDNGATARTGADFYVKDDSTDDHTVIDIVKTGSGATTGFSYDEQYNGSTTSFAISINLTDSDAIDTTAVIIARGTGTRTVPMLNLDDASTGNAALIDIDLSGVFTANVIDFASAAAATGNVLFVNLDNAVAMTAIRIEGSGIRTQPYFELVCDGGGSADLISIAINGGTPDGDIIAIDMDTAIAARALYIDAGAGTRTNDVIEIKDDGDGNNICIDINTSRTGTGSILDITVGPNVFTGDVISINMKSPSTTGSVLDVDMDAALAYVFLKLDTGGSTRTADMCEVTFDGAGQKPFWDINITNTGAGGGPDYWDIDVTGVFTGSVLDIVYGAAATGDAIVVDMTSAVGASALAVTGAGARTDDLIKIDDASTGAGARSIFDINITGAGTFPVLDINIGNSAVNATAILITEGTGTGAVPLINIDSAGTGATATIDIDYTGVFTGNAIDITYGTAAATGNAIDLNMGTNVAGMAIAIASAATGVNNEGAALHIAHTGNLTAGADLARITDSGNASSTSNLLFIEGSGTGTAGSYALYINATDSMEAIRVDAGTVTFDESLSVGTTLTVTGVATFTAGQQSAAVTVTPTANGAGSGTIVDGTTFVSIDGNTPDWIIILPTPTVGNVIWLYDANDVGVELRSNSTSTVAINGGTGAAAESRIDATELVRCVCTSATTWVCSTFDVDGDEAKLEAAA